MSQLSFAIHCNYSGLPLGTLSYITVAGHVPFLSHWKEMQALHPVFSFPSGKLLAFTRSEWNRLAKASINGEATAKEEQLLQVAFLALLHSLGSIKQEEPALPSIATVHECMTRLFALAGWKHYLESSRFRFPSFKINRTNANTAFENIGDYFDVCFSVKEDYETNVNELEEAEKVAAADRAMRALRNQWVVPTSNKQLFRWICAYLPAKYEADKMGWMSTIFCGSEKTILDFDKEDIELLDEIITSEVPIGNAISHAVRQRLNEIAKIWEDNKEAFTVDFDSFDVESALSGIRLASKAPTSLTEPQQHEFETKAAWIKAKALFYIQQRQQPEAATLPKQSQQGQL